jgi:putative hydrolase of the HAD superfamily
MVKDKRITIRLNEYDYQGIQKKAMEMGIPYQTLISGIIHRYIEGDMTPRFMSKDEYVKEAHEIKAVVFDFFGTLVPNFSLKTHTSVLRKMAAMAGAPVEPFVHRWFSTFTERVTGVFQDVESNIRSICNEFGVEPSGSECARAAELRFAYERQHIIPRPSAESTLRDLRKRGYKTALISDCSSELPVLWKETVFPPLFDVTVFSCLAGMKKPNPSIFRLACKELQVACESCVYVGDGGSKELSGAADVGMVPILLLDEQEQNNADTHRVDGEVWKGQTVSDLKDLIPYLERT